MGKSVWSVRTIYLARTDQFSDAALSSCANAIGRNLADAERNLGQRCHLRHAWLTGETLYTFSKPADRSRCGCGVSPGLSGHTKLDRRVV